MTWKEALQQARYRYVLVYIVISAVLFFTLMPSYFAYIEGKPGRLLYDPILHLLPAYDVSLIIFLIMHAVVWSTVVVNFRNPKMILIMLATYCTVNYMRGVTLYLFTLEPPVNWVMMHDPIVSLIAYEPAFAKDLFFSGHTATLMATLLPEPNIVFKRIKMVATLLVALLLLVQHIHYTIDVLAAPVFTYLSYKLMLKIMS